MKDYKFHLVTEKSKHGNICFCLSVRKGKEEPKFIVQCIDAMDKKEDNFIKIFKAMIKQLNEI